MRKSARILNVVRKSLTTIQSNMENRVTKEKSIFYAAIAVTDTGQREQLLESLCGGDPKVRHSVDKLLAAHRDESVLNALPGDSDDLVDVVADMREGQTIGRYKVLEKIGEGGFGVVYMAEQTDPIQRRVALKIIKAGMDTNQVVGRFEAERQALALMEHPHIAKVIDAGSTASGRPYFVMELVHGIDVTSFCDEHVLSTEERLDIFMDVCSAIHHAHQKGIIHRDIKPSNILVSHDGERPIAKVIDFGIAKATQGRLTDKTLFTNFRQLIGTPAYMSPEQAQMTSSDIDTRSDIYSLGVLLYELLTGTAPFDSHELLESGFEEMCRRIRETEPEKPSTRLSGLTFVRKTNTARLRRTEIASLEHTIRGELDWIVMKAIDKNRVRRYESAHSMKLDIKRFLSNEPVSAAAPTTAYKISKFAVRNKKVIIAAGFFAAILTLGTVVSTWLAIRATRQTVRANASEAKAAHNLTLANQLREKAEMNENSARRNQYAAKMIGAQRAVGGASADNVWETLNELIPSRSEDDFRGFEWRALWNRYRGELFSLEGHENEVRSIAFSPDGRWLASGSTDGTARLWNVQTRQQVWKHVGEGESPGQETHCNLVRFSADAKQLCTKFWRSQSILWDISDPLHPMQIGQQGPGDEPTGKGTAIGVRDGRVTEWSLSGEVVQEFVDPAYANGSSHGGRIFKIEISPSGERLVTAGGDAKVKIWNADTGELLYQLQGDTSGVRDVTVSPDGRIIATSSEYGVVGIWDAQGSQLNRIQLENMPIDYVEFSSDGRSLLVSERYSGIRAFETTTWSESSVFSSRHGVIQLACSPTEPNLAASADTDGVIRFWDTSPTKDVFAHPSPVRCLKFSPDAKVLAVGLANGAVQFWNMESKSNLLLTPSTKTVNPFAFEEVLLTAYKPDFVTFSPDSSKAAIIGDEQRVTIWDLHKGRPKIQIDFPSPKGKFASLAFSPNGKQLYTGARQAKNDDRMLVWNLENPAELERLRFEDKSSGLGHLAISPDNTTLVASGPPGILVFWSLKDRRWLRTIPHGGFSLCFAPDGSLLATGADSSVRMWNPRTWKERRLRLRDVVWSVDFAPDGNRFVASDISGMTKMWDIESWQPVATYLGSIAEFSPDGAVLAIGCEDRFNSHIMPQSGRVRLHYAPPLHEIDSKRTVSPR